MSNATNSRSELKLEAVRVRQEQVQQERDDVREKKAERTAKLRALRLIKEAAERKAAANTTVEKSG